MRVQLASPHVPDVRGIQCQDEKSVCIHGLSRRAPASSHKEIPTTEGERRENAKPAWLTLDSPFALHTPSSDPSVAPKDEELRAKVEYAWNKADPSVQKKYIDMVTRDKNDPRNEAEGELGVGIDAGTRLIVKGDVNSVAGYEGFCEKMRAPGSCLFEKLSKLKESEQKALLRAEWYNITNAERKRYRVEAEVAQAQGGAERRHVADSALPTAGNAQRSPAWKDIEKRGAELSAAPSREAATAKMVLDLGGFIESALRANGSTS